MVSPKMINTGIAIIKSAQLLSGKQTHSDSHPMPKLHCWIYLYSIHTDTVVTNSSSDIGMIFDEQTCYDFYHTQYTMNRSG